MLVAMTLSCVVIDDQPCCPACPGELFGAGRRRVGVNAAGNQGMCLIERWDKPPIVRCSLSGAMAVAERASACVA